MHNLRNKENIEEYNVPKNKGKYKVRQKEGEETDKKKIKKKKPL